ncbi:hypothetical protein ABIB25_004280 [Nakamurella sp. UYEF19]
MIFGISACGEADTMRGYNQDGSPTVDFTSAVSDFLGAVHSSNAEHLNQIEDPSSSPDGVNTLIAAYAGATLSVATYDFDHPGDGGVDVDVVCENGARATFTQGFIGRAGTWRPVIYNKTVTSPDTHQPLPDEALSAPIEAAPTGKPGNPPTVTYYIHYPPCSG